MLRCSGRRCRQRSGRPRRSLGVRGRPSSGWDYAAALASCEEDAAALASCRKDVAALLLAQASHPCAMPVQSNPADLASSRERRQRGDTDVARPSG